MSDVLELSDADFALQMRGLIHEAEQALDRTGIQAKPLAPEPAAGSLAEASSEPTLRPAPAAHPPSVPDMLRPVVQGVQAIGRATGEHTQILGKLEKAAGESAEARRELPQIVADLRALAEQRNQVSKQMFDALHEELKTYKDGFLLDTLHRPMIRDLITLHDDLSQIHHQMHEALSVHPVLAQADGSTERLDYFQRLQNIEVHIEHNIDFILEVLARLEVQRLPVGSGKLEKHTQRAVAVEPAEDAAAHLEIIRSVKRGFLWKDRIVRPEEVVVKKWKDGILVALPPGSP